ncbi:MAG: GatB/YqeY domain-containing protein [Cardiobacteriaceae bacterium]|nr:GatB/YqeY domain-containing protein [Cardiobacteriaceae bacterium]
MSIKEQLQTAIKQAMVAKDKLALQTLRMVSAAFKQIEVDQRIEVTDEIAIRELVRLVKQRQDAAKQYRDAGRIDLAEQEEAEILLIQPFLPKALSPEEVQAEILRVFTESGLEKNMASMRPLMDKLKPVLEGRADMSQVSQAVRALLTP